MKKLLILLSCLWSVAYGQSKIYLRGDSVQIERSGGNAELILLNGSRNITGGVLTNLGGGRTGFVIPSSGSGGRTYYAGYGLVKINDSTFAFSTALRDSIIASAGGGDTSGYKYFAAQYPLILTGVGDTARLSIDTAALGGGGSVALPYKNIDSLRLHTAASGQGSSTLGYSAPGDGGAASYYWDATSTATDDSLLVIKVTGVTTGRWRQLIVNATVNPKTGGAKGDGATDDYWAVQRSFASAVANGYMVQFPKGTFMNSGTWVAPQNLVIRGSGNRQTIFRSTSDTTLMTFTSSNLIEDIRFFGNNIGSTGLLFAGGNKAFVNRCRFENFKWRGFANLNGQNSEFNNNFSQYNGYFNYWADGEENCIYTNCNFNSDETQNETIETIGLYNTNGNNSHWVGGLGERGPGRMQVYIKGSANISFTDMQFNSGTASALVVVDDATASFTRVQFSVPGYPSVNVRTIGVNAKSNITDCSTVGANGRGNNMLYAGNNDFNGSAEVPLFSSNFAGSTKGTATTNATLTWNDAGQNMTVTTTAVGAGFGTGLGSGSGVMKPGQVMEAAFTVKGITDSSYVDMYISKSGGREFYGSFAEGPHKIYYQARGYESPRVDFLYSKIGSFTVSMLTLKLMGGNDSLAVGRVTADKSRGIYTPALDTSASKHEIFSAAQVKSLSRNSNKSQGVPFNEGSLFLGNSITVGYAPEGMITPWPSLVGSALGITPNNLATSSSGSRWAVYRAHINTGTLQNAALGAMTGFNDMRPSTTSDSAAKISTTVAGARALAAYQFTKTIQFYRMGTVGAVNTNITASGSAPAARHIDSLNDYGSRAGWFQVNDPANTTANIWYKTSVTANETVTIAGVNGPAIAVGTWATDGVQNNWSRIRVTVDGVIKGTYTPNGQTYATNGTGFFSLTGIQNDAIIMTGFADTLHTVVLTFLDGGRVGAWDYVAGLKSPQASQSAPLYLLDIPHMNATGYAASGAVTTEGLLDSATARKRTELTALLPAYPIFYVATNKYFDPNDATQQSVDGIHPISKGQQNIARAVLENINAAYLPKLNLTNVTGGVVADQRLVVGSNTSRYMGMERTRLFWNDLTTSTANNRVWDAYAGSDRWVLRMLNDANNAETEIMRVNRTAMTLDHVSFPNGNFRIGGTTGAAKFHVTGTVRFDALGTTQTDTTVFKPTGIDATGNVVKMQSWPGASGGSATTPGGVSGNIQMNRNGAFFGTDSLRWFTGIGKNLLYTTGSFGSSSFSGSNAGHIYTDATAGEMVGAPGEYKSALTGTTGGTTNNSAEVTTFDASGGAITFAITPTETLVTGMKRILTFVKTDATSNAVTLTGTVNGATNYVLTAPGSSVTMQWVTGTSWIIINSLSPAIRLSTTTATGITPTGSAALNYYDVTALATSLTVAAPSGSAVNQNQIILRFTDNSTPRALTFTGGAGGFRSAGSAAIPTTTVPGQTLYVQFMYNASVGMWDFVGSNYATVPLFTVGTASGSLTLSTSDYYTFTGSTATWTLPDATLNTGKAYYIKNKGSGTLTINAASGTQIYTTTAASSTTIAAGGALLLISDGTHFGTN